MSLHSIIKSFRNTDILKTVFFHIKYGLPFGSLMVYPKSVIEIHKTANLKITNGALQINKSWFDTRKRRFISELRLDKNSTLICNGNFSLYQGASVYVAPNAKLTVKGNAFLNTNSTLNCFCAVELGNGVAISDNVEIQDSDNHFIDGQKDSMSAPIKIEDNVWIGKNAIILKGVTVGKGSVIGAGAVVTKNIPPNSVAVGNPAAVIKTVNHWE